MRPVVLFRAGRDTMDEDELRIVQEHFTCFRERAAIQKDHFVIGRYSCLPFFEELQAEIDYVGAAIINNVNQHRYVADLCNWAEDLRELTPKTWYRLEDIDEEGPYVLKGKTNSRKFDWKTHCYAKDRKTAGDVHWRLSTDGLIGMGQQDIYIRKYVPLKTLLIGLNDLPIANEFRIFVAFGEVLCGAYYWSNYVDDLPEVPSVDQVPKGLIAEAIQRIGNRVNFYALDVAQKADGGWIVIEINDGQQSGLSENEPELLYSNLKRVLAAKGIC
jgi:hypothetical protein